MVGKVKWFNNDRGFGFITCKEHADIFVHYSVITSDGYKSLTEGQEVQFDLIQTDRGPQAINVCPVKETIA